MKIHDFGLWFQTWSGVWFSTIPEKRSFTIFYDGQQIGSFTKDLLRIDYGAPYILRLKNIYNYNVVASGSIDLGRRLTLDDFFIEKVVYELVWTVG